MNAIGIILVLIAAVVVTHWLDRMMGGRVALPLVQIAVGAVIGLTTSFGVQLEPEMFFVLFLPPLLFLDGWRVPKQDLQDNAVTILSLAFGLVFLTVLGVGLLLNLMIPAMPLPVCFALAAVLSPTDVVAATAMVTNVPIPRRVLRILEGEALFNDASGLVCLRLAVAVAMTGSFTVWSSLAELVWAAAGGIALGLAFSQVISIAKLWIATRIGEDTSSQILVSLLTPYGAYLLADAIHCSPVLAAVAAGIMMSRIEVSAQTLAVTRIRRSAVWETLQFALNGSIFLLLGEQLPGILARFHAGTAESGHDGFGWVVLYILGVSAALGTLRFAWVWVSIGIWLRRHVREAGGRRRPDWRLTLAMSVAGVRGAITLAGALSLPLALPDGAPFPSRDLAILVAAGVILVSLVTANLSLPGLLRGVTMPPDRHTDQQEHAARIEAAQAAITALARIGAAGDDREGERLAAVAQVAEYYQHRLAQLQPDGRSPPAGNTLREEGRLHIAGLRAERAAIVNLARGHRITTDLAHKLLSEIDLAEQSFQVAAQSGTEA